MSMQLAEALERKFWTEGIADDIKKAIDTDPRHLAYEWVGRQVDDRGNTTLMAKTETGHTFNIMIEWTDC